MDLSCAQGPQLEYYINRCQVLEREIEELKKANKIAIKEERMKSNATIKKLENEVAVQGKTIYNLRNDIEKYKKNKDMCCCHCIESLSIIEEKKQTIEEMKERLEDYKRIKMLIPIEQALKAEYNKAIDDFVRFASDMPTVEEEDGTIRPMWLEEMAEKLKEKYNE